MLQKRMFEEAGDASHFDRINNLAKDYVHKAFDRHVYPDQVAQDSMKEFEESLPEEIGSVRDVLDKLEQIGTPATVSQIGGRYFGFVNGAVVPAGMYAKALATFWDQNSGMQVISPLAAKLEMVVEAWLKDLFGLKEDTVVGFVSGTSSGNLCGLVAARYRVLKNQGWDVVEKGLTGAPKIRIITGDHAHTSAMKAVSLAGLGKGNIEWVGTDKQGRIISEAIPELDETCILMLQAGNVNSGSFDPFDEICKKAKEQGAWIHIDGAFGLWAGATKRFKHLTAGYEYADSMAADAHKTLNAPYDSGLIFCRDEEALITSLHMSGGYIIKGKDRDGMFYTPEMSRRARIFELWAILKYLGRDGVDEMISTMHDRAVQFGDGFQSMDGFEVLNDIVFNQVLVRCPSDEITDRVIKHVQDSGICWVGGSVWDKRRVIRISVCSWATTEKDVALSLSAFAEAYSKVR